MIGNLQHRYDHSEGIFFRNGPNKNQNAIAKCPSCRTQFKNRNEMVYCTFCGNSNDEKCVTKTRLYP